MGAEINEVRIRLCKHVALDGAVCKEPALRDSRYCRHHRRVHVPPLPDYMMEIYPDRKAFLRAIQGASQDIGRCILDRKTLKRITANLQQAQEDFARRDREAAEAAKAAKAANFTKKH